MPNKYTYFNYKKVIYYIYIYIFFFVLALVISQTGVIWRYTIHGNSIVMKSKMEVLKIISSV